VIVFWIIHNLCDSDLGRSMVAVRDSESAAESLGISAIRYKLMAFVFASAFAGLAGALYASLARYVNPNNFTLTLSFVILAMVVIGGLGSNLGAILGGVVMVLLPESTHFLGRYHLMVYSFLLILVVIFAPHGIMGLLQRRTPKPGGTAARRQDGDELPHRDPRTVPNAGEREPRSFFEVRTLSKTFGGLTALHQVSFSVKPGSITGIIGPNGAGKTTLFNIITGMVPASEGSIVFRDHGISGLKTHIISRQGIIRTFQNVNLFADLSVHENVLIGTHRDYTAGVLESLLRFPSLGRKERLSRRVADEILEITGLTDVRDELCRNLPFGRQRIVETARALAARPRLILLDEPAAGLASWEKESLRETLLQINDRFGITILLIDHSVHFVTQICQQIIVLDSGQVIAEGTPVEIQASPVVQEAYLGKMV
jgi:branched-chain amino acid transport system permease protein